MYSWVFLEKRILNSNFVKMPKITENGGNNMINKLVEKIRKTGAPIVVGLDPMLNYIPQHIQDKAYAEFGETLEGAAEAIWQFNIILMI